MRQRRKKKDEQKLLDLYLQSSINIEVINKKSESIQKEIATLEFRKSKFQEDTSNDNISLIDTFNKKEENDLLNINNTWESLSREDKKMIISKYIKQIEIVTYDNFEIAIKNVIFQNDFIKDGINNLTNIATSCIIKSNEEIFMKKYAFNDDSSGSLLNITNKPFNETLNLLNNCVYN